MKEELWCGMKIPIIVLSGEVNSGKTLFGLLIDQNCRKSSAKQKPTTIWWDNEGSAETYSGSLNFNWRDVRSAIADGFHLKTMEPSDEDPKWRKILLKTADVNDSPSASLFRAWYLNLLSVEPGQFSVAGVDTFTPIQAGLVDWLRAHPEAFGRTSSQYDRAASMFLWPDVKTMLSYILATDCRLRFDTFVMTVHMRNEWSGGSRTGRRIAEGLDVLDKLCTLHLELDRTPKAKGKEAPRIPSAIVIKERLVRFGESADQDAPILPPRLPMASADAIRQYIQQPADYAKLKPDERMPDDKMSDDEKLRAQMIISENERAAEESKLTRLEMIKQQTPSIESADQKPSKQPEQPKRSDMELATPSQINELERRLKNTFDTKEEAKQWFLKGSRGKKPHELPRDAMDACLEKLALLEAEAIKRRADAKLLASKQKKKDEYSEIPF